MRELATGGVVLTGASTGKPFCHAVTSVPWLKKLGARLLSTNVSSLFNLSYLSHQFYTVFLCNSPLSIPDRRKNKRTKDILYPFTYY